MMSRYRWLRLSAPIVGRVPWLAYPAAAAAGWATWRVKARWGPRAPEPQALGRDAATG